MDPESLDPDPFRQLRRWFEQAEATACPQPESFALATASDDGAPSVRIVLLRGWDRDGLRFFTDRRSRKGREIAANPRAAAVFHWAELERQVRIHGTVTEIDADRSLAYFLTRPPGSRISAWASHQGEQIASRSELERRYREREAEGVADRLPPHWGGYRLEPAGFEFWESRPDRLHDRVEYLPAAGGTWQRRRLQP